MSTGCETTIYYGPKLIVKDLIDILIDISGFADKNEPQLKYLVYSLIYNDEETQPVELVVGGSAEFGCGEHYEYGIAISGYMHFGSIDFPLDSLPKPSIEEINIAEKYCKENNIKFDASDLAWNCLIYKA